MARVAVTGNAPRIPRSLFGADAYVNIHAKIPETFVRDGQGRILRGTPQLIDKGVPPSALPHGRVLQTVQFLQGTQSRYPSMTITVNRPQVTTSGMHGSAQT